MIDPARVGTAEGVGVHFELQVTDRDGWVVLAPTGELDLASAPRLRQEAVQLVSGGARRVVLDLAGVDFLDSMGAGVVVAVRKRLHAVGGELRLARPEPQVRRVLELAGLHLVMPLHDTIDDAVAAAPASPEAEIAPGG